MPVSKIPGAGISGGSVTVNQTAPDNSLVIDSSGNVGIGTSTVASGRRFQVEASGDTIQRINSGGASSGLSVEFANNGTLRGGIGNGSGNISGGSATTFAIQAVNEMVFASGGYSERMRIDSSGRVLVGLTSWAGGATNAGIAIKSTSNSASVFAFYIDNTSSNILNVRCDGSTYNTTGVWGTISDQRLKENIVDATPKLDNLLQLKVRNFNFTSDENKTKQIGFVAQEIEQVFPSLVSEDAEGTKAVKTTVLLPMLVKAIQELKAELDTVKVTVEAQAVRIAELEGAK